MLEKSDFDYICDHNGFEIRQHPSDFFYRVFLPQWEGRYVDDFNSFDEAKRFCHEEESWEWEEEFRSNI